MRRQVSHYPLLRNRKVRSNVMLLLWWFTTFKRTSLLTCHQSSLHQLTQLHAMISQRKRMLRDGHTSMGSIYQRWKLGLAYLLVMPIRKHLNQERLSRAEEKAHFLLGWTINGPLGSKSTGGSHTANLVKGDIELEEKFKRFCNQEFSDYCGHSHANV